LLMRPDFPLCGEFFPQFAMDRGRIPYFAPIYPFSPRPIVDRQESERGILHPSPLARNPAISRSGKFCPVARNGGNSDGDCNRWEEHTSELKTIMHITYAA